jgi:hypothetical protein
MPNDQAGAGLNTTPSAVDTAEAVPAPASSASELLAAERESPS